MTEREQFEKVVSVPDTMIRWDEGSQSYVSVRGGLSMTADTYNDRLRVWQAARATPALTERIRELEEALANYITQIDRDNKNAAAPLVVGEKERQRACDALRATPALPQAEHDLEDVRCQCCGYMTYHSEHMGCIRSAYKQALPQVPEGKVLVPMEPTESMLVEGFSHYRRLETTLGRQGALDDYAAMLAASQEQGK